MRRIIVALFAMTTGTALLVGLKSHVLAVPLGLAAEQPLDPAGGDGWAAGTPEPSAAGSPAATPTTGPGASTTAAAPPPAATTTTTAPAVEPPPQAVSGTFAGVAVAVKTAQSPNPRSSQCGDCHNYSMSVTITVSNGQIVNATVAYNPAPGESLRYADKATNTLSPKILGVQTWMLGNVSGATYSANAFELSVKDAMAKAGLPT